MDSCIFEVKVSLASRHDLLQLKRRAGQYRSICYSARIFSDSRESASMEALSRISERFTGLDYYIHASSCERLNDEWRETVDAYRWSERPISAAITENIRSLPDWDLGQLLSVHGRQANDTKLMEKISQGEGGIGE